MSKKLAALTKLLESGEVTTASAMPKRRPGIVASALHADVSQCFCPLDGVRAATADEIRLDASARSVRGRPPKSPLCRLLLRSPPTAAQLQNSATRKRAK